MPGGASCDAAGPGPHAVREVALARDEQFLVSEAEQCPIDHVRPRAEGGLTTQANGRPACAFHNRRRRC